MKSTAPRPVMPKEVEALRASLDARLSALEKALADPAQHGSLESLILELARIATAEADATARQAVLDAQKAGQTAAAAARKEATAALEAEKVESAALRQVIDGAKLALKQAEAALKDERHVAEAATREVAGTQRELAALQHALEEERSARASQRRDLDAALASLDAERARVSAVEQEVGQARARDASEREALAGDLEHERELLEGERAASAELLQTTSDLERRLELALGELNASRGERDAAQRDHDGVRAELDAVRRELDSHCRDAEARAQTLSQSQSEQEQALHAAHDSTRSVETRLEQAIGEREVAQHESAELRRQLEAAEAAVREMEAANRELQAAHEARDAAEVEAARGIERHVELDADAVVDLTSLTRDEERQMAIDRRTRALEQALKEAEMRAESAEFELGRHRSSARAELAETPAETPAAAASEAQEQFRGPSRGAKRVSFKSEITVQIDGATGKLVDLSATGAQVLAPAAINPNRLVTVTLPMGDGTIPCKAKVMWSRLEPRAGQLWYRAGVCFTNATQLPIDAFLRQHQT